MAVVIKKQPKRSLTDKSTKYFPTVKSRKLVREREVARLLSKETPLSSKEAEVALAELQNVILRLLQGGYTVQLGDWASFFLTVSADGTADPAQCTPELIKTVRCHCRFTPAFREVLQQTEFVPQEEVK